MSLTLDQLKVLDAIADAIHPEVSEDNFSDIKLLDGCNVDFKAFAAKVPSKIPNFHTTVAREFTYFSQSTQAAVKQLLDILGNRALAPLFTRSFTLFTAMTIAERQAVLKMWQESRFFMLRSTQRALVDLVTIFLILNDDDMCEAMNYPARNELFTKHRDLPFWKPDLLQPEGDTLEYDVAIVGSGSAGGVAAYKLSKAGYKCLVIERGRYFDFEKGNVTDAESLEIYLHNARLGSTDGGFSTTTGSIVGGGGAVNWSCSLDPVEGVRREWAQTAPWYNEPVFDDALRQVRQVMNTTTDVEHSFGNQALLDGLKVLHWHNEVIPQNTGGHYHNTGFQGWGHRHGEKGGVVNWLHTACANGCDILAETRVNRILHHGGKATGLELLRDNGKRIEVKAKRIVVAGGAMSTPPLLLNSGFRNKHIGQGLKLHPASVVFGEYDDVVNKRDDAVMTVVSNEFTNLDGQNHGPRLEVCMHTPTFMARFLPWRSGEQYRRDCAHAMNMVPLLVLNREKGGNGRVYGDPDDPLRPAFDYVVSDLDAENQKIGSIAAAKILYVQGAKRIIIPHRDIPDFVTSKKAPRYITDPDFAEWVRKAEKTKWIASTYTVTSAHQMASCSVSNRGPSHSAVDVNGKLHECKNVHIVDSSALPSASGSNPMISTMATAWVLTDEVLRELGKAKI